MMRSIFLIPLCLLFFASPNAKIFAQNASVMEVEKLMAVGSRPAFRIDFSQASPERVEKLWKNFVKDQYNGKLKKNKKAIEWVVYGLQSSSISSESFDLYSVIESSGKDASVLYVWFDLGAYFLNQRDNPDKAKNATETLIRFFNIVKADVISDELKAAENKQKEVEKKLKNLEKDKEKLLKDIESYREKIKKAESDIEVNEKEQTKTQGEIDAQRKAVDAVRLRLDAVGKE